MEQKTIFEELLDEAPAVHEKRRKLTKAKHCISHEEWNEADAIYEEILAEFPDDEEALKGKLLLKRRKEQADKEHQREEEKKRLREEKKQKREEKKLAREAEEKRLREEEEAEAERVEPMENSRKPRSSNRRVLTLVLILVMVLAAVAAVVGIISHRNSIKEMYAENETAVTDTYLITEQKTGV